MLLTASSCFGSASQKLVPHQQGALLREQERLKELYSKSRRLTPPPQKRTDPKQKNKGLSLALLREYEISVQGLVLC